MLYGADGTTSMEVNDTTPQWKIGEFALVLSHRQLFGDAGADPVDAPRLTNVVQRSSRQVRSAILSMAQDLRRETWFDDKHRMERTIPVFEALVQTDSKWHVPHGNLGYALKDKYNPDYTRALESLTRAVELRGDRRDEGDFYQYSRAQCLIHLDMKFLARQPADAKTRGRVHKALEAAEHELGTSWERVMRNSDAADIRAWLEVNPVRLTSAKHAPRPRATRARGPVERT